MLLTDIGEGIGLREDIIYRDQMGEFVVVRNPSRQQFRTLLTRAREHDLRGLIVEGTLIVWDAYFWDHQQARQHLEIRAANEALLEFEANLIYVDLISTDQYFDGSAQTEEVIKFEVHDLAADVFRTCPQIVRLHSPPTKVLAQVNFYPEGIETDCEGLDVDLGTLADFL